MTPTQFVKMVAALHYDQEEIDGKIFDQGNDDVYDCLVTNIEQARQIVKERKG